MAKAKSKLNNKSSKVIDKAFLEANPVGLPDEYGLVHHAVNIPVTRKIVFLNGRDPGVALHFHYHSKTHPLKNYTLYHGYEHELSEEVIDHLENCRESQYAFRRNERGEVEHYVKGHKYIFQCRSVKSVRAA